MNPCLLLTILGQHYTLNLFSVTHTHARTHTLLHFYTHTLSFPLFSLSTFWTFPTSLFKCPTFFLITLQLNLCQRLQQSQAPTGLTNSVLQHPMRLIPRLPIQLHLSFNDQNHLHPLSNQRHLLHVCLFLQCLHIIP